MTTLTFMEEGTGPMALALFNFFLYCLAWRLKKIEGGMLAVASIVWYKKTARMIPRIPQWVSVLCTLVGFFILHRVLLVGFLVRLVYWMLCPQAKEEVKYHRIEISRRSPLLIHFT
jgi:hypothetical protein